MYFSNPVFTFTLEILPYLLFYTDFKEYFASSLNEVSLEKEL